jgi:hypothetical protein
MSSNDLHGFCCGSEAGQPGDLSLQFFRELLKPRRGGIVRNKAGKAAGECGLLQQVGDRDKGQWQSGPHGYANADLGDSKRRHGARAARDGRFCPPVAVD